MSRQLLYFSNLKLAVKIGIFSSLVKVQSVSFARNPEYTLPDLIGVSSILGLRCLLAKRGVNLFKRAIASFDNKQKKLNNLISSV